MAIFVLILCTITSSHGAVCTTQEFSSSISCNKAKTMIEERGVARGIALVECVVK